MATLTSLPPELTREVLYHLPIPSLLAFGLTSKENHAIQSCSLSTLRLGVFNSRLAGMISLIEAPARNCRHSVQMILPKHEAQTRDTIIRNQNLKIRAVVDTYQKSLRDLEVALWEFQESSASSIANLTNLRELSIRLDHPHTRFAGIDPAFWASSPGSTAWNLLASKPGGVGALGRLHSLNLERAGITDYQLARVLDRNPMLTELRLRKCFTLTDKAFKVIAESRVARRLEIFHFTWAYNDGIDERVLGYIAKLPKIKSLSLRGCRIESELVKKLNDEQWHIPDLTLPSTADSPKEAVGVDDEYK